MRKMSGFIGIAVVAAGLLFTPQALAYNQTITVYATVLPQRVLYIDESGTIVRVAGNTIDNIEPVAYDKNNQPVTITDSIMQQYQRFLMSHGNHLEASKVYTVNPIVVDTSANNQTISLQSTPIRLTLNL
jgi:hypothetical protein